MLANNIATILYQFVVVVTESSVVNQIRAARVQKLNSAIALRRRCALQDKFRKLTSLEQVDEDGDLELVCEVTGYDVKATAITAGEVAAQNRLTVTVKIEFSNRKYPEDDVTQSFSAYEDFPSDSSLDAVEGSLCETIIEKIVEDIFNATVAQW